MKAKNTKREKASIVRAFKGTLWVTIFFFLARACLAQSFEVDARALLAAGTLTGNSSREWILTKTTSYMASNKPCMEPTKYKFTTDHQVVITECDGSTIKTSSHTWSIRSSGRVDLDLTIDSLHYRLLIKDNAFTPNEIILRTPSTSVVFPTTDLEFVSSPEGQQLFR